MKITLFKRGKTYHAKTTVLGTVQTVSTGVHSKRFASKIAEDKLTRLLEESDKVWRVKYLVDEFTRNAFHIRTKTATGVRNFVKMYLTTIGASFDDPIEKVFTKDNANVFFRTRLAGASHSARTSAATTANTVLRSCKQLFSERMFDTYSRPLPDCIKDFKSVKSLQVRVKQYQVSDKKAKMLEVIQKCEALKDTNPEAYLSFWLMLHCGLRRGEAASARWSWLSERGLIVQEEDDFSTKSGRSRLIPLSEKQIEHLRSFQGECEHIIPGNTIRSRYREAIDPVAKIIRKAGFTGNKSVHELRKYFGANVATQLGLFAAQKYLGHHSPEITSRYYADLIDAKPIEIQILS